MKTLKTIFLILALNTTALTTQAVELTITVPKQVAGYYHHQIGNTPITALLDGINCLNSSIFQN